MRHLEILECRPIRRASKWKVLTGSFGFGFLLGACVAVVFWAVIF